MKKDLEFLSRGEISFDEFARRTSTDWTRLAGKLYMAWRKNIPVGVELEDVRQEMLLNAWISVGKWRAEGGMPLKGFVVCRAWQEGTRFIHVQRSAKRRSDKSESRHAVSFSEMLKDSETDWTECLLSTDSDAGDLIDARSKFERAMKESRGVDQYALVALRMAFGNLPAAGELLFDDTEIRLQARLSSPRAAVKHIENTVRAYCA